MIFSENAFGGSTILVTGASSGIGRSAAQLLAHLGARIIATGRSPERLQETVGTLGEADHRSVVADLNDMEMAATTVAEAAKDAGGLDGIFHCAGLEMVKQMRLIKQKNLDDILGAAVFGALGIAKAASKTDVMKPNSSIVFMSSVAAQRGRAGMVLYSAAKAASDGMVRSLACELAPKSIRVNAIAAGGVETPMHDRLTHSLTPEAIDGYRNAHLLGFGTPEDVGNAAAFLLSGASRWVTGTTMVVDGGYMAS